VFSHRNKCYDYSVCESVFKKNKRMHGWLDVRLWVMCLLTGVGCVLKVMIAGSEFAFCVQIPSCGVQFVLECYSLVLTGNGDTNISRFSRANQPSGNYPRRA
jgi:hypothetical protein